MIFDILWCSESGNFSVFYHPAAYLCKLFIALLFALPAALNAPRSVGLVLCAAFDTLLTANLLYFRTYFTAIPLESYLLAGNLRDFLPAVGSSLHLSDLLLPLTTFGAAVVLRLTPRRRVSSRTRRRMFTALLVAGLLPYLCMLYYGGFRKSYEHLLAGHRSHVCAVPEFTVLGTLCYDALRERVRFSPVLRQQVEAFLADRPTEPVPIFEPHGSVVVLLLESFESWLLEREAAGIEITPHLNGFLREEGTIYAPHVLTQVKGGRSIDAQLLLTAGLLPIDNGCYSTVCPESTYPSLVEALREKHPGLFACAFTPDNPTVWNQQVVARRLGFDRLIARPDLRPNGVATGKRMDDEELFERCLASLDTLAASGRRHLYVQCITYSGHAPFRLPDPIRPREFEELRPEKLRDYLTAARYTDAAVGEFIARLRRMPVFSDALIVITGDHEGLAAARPGLVASSAGSGLVAERQFTPLLVLNAPLTLRYEPVLGQVDIYPTLCDLLGVNDYFWPGLGHSILRRTMPPAAADPHLRIVGDTSRLTAAQAERLRAAWGLSDRIIRSDYFARTGRK